MPLPGPVVRDTSRVFDHFWNGDWAVPIAALVKRPYTEADLKAFREIVHKRIAEDKYPYPLDQDVDDLKSELTVDTRPVCLGAGPDCLG